MFETLSERFNSTFRNLSGRGRISEENIRENILNEIFNRVTTSDADTVGRIAQSKDPSIRFMAVQIVSKIGTLRSDRHLLKLLRDYRPDYLVVAIDVAGDRESFRSELYPQYKANRVEVPDDFHPQVERCVEILRTMNVPVVGAERPPRISTERRASGSPRACSSPLRLW